MKKVYIIYLDGNVLHHNAKKFTPNQSDAKLFYSHAEAQNEIIMNDTLKPAFYMILEFYQKIKTSHL